MLQQGKNYLVQCSGQLTEVSVRKITDTSYELNIGWITKDEFSKSYIIVEDLGYTNSTNESTIGNTKQLLHD